VPVRSTSVEASVELKKQGVKPQLIYLDAKHYYKDALEDLAAWYPFIKETNGVFAGDDWGWGEGGVGKAVAEFAITNGLCAHTNQWFWFFTEGKC